MKQLTKMRNTSGNSLAEFAVVIALMATLMSTGQVKFSQAGEGGKGKKTGEELDKIGKAGRNFYNAMNDLEGAGRFPGQDKWDINVPCDDPLTAKPYAAGVDKAVAGVMPSEAENNAFTPSSGYATLGAAIADIEAKMTSYQDQPANPSSFLNWVSVFGKSEPGFEINFTHTSKISANDSLMLASAADSDRPNKGIGHLEFGEYVDPVKSPFLDGHYMYTVIGGTIHRQPVLVVTDFYAPAAEFVVVVP